MSVTPAARQPSRQPQAWLTFNVRHLLRWHKFHAMKESFEPELFGEAGPPAMRLRERTHFPVESAFAIFAGGDSRVVLEDVFRILSRR